VELKQQEAAEDAKVIIIDGAYVLVITGGIHPHHTTYTPACTYPDRCGGGGQGCEGATPAGAARGTLPGPEAVAAADDRPCMCNDCDWVIQI